MKIKSNKVLKESKLTVEKMRKEKVTEEYGLKDVFKKHLPHIKFDEKLGNKIQRFKISWMNRDKPGDQEHVEFLSKPYIGVNPIKFTPSDHETFFVDILEVDVKRLNEDLLKLEDIHKERAVTSNPFYLSISYLLHGYITNNMPWNKKHKIMIDIYMIFAYRVVSSILNHYFSYPLNKDIAILAHEKLSNRFLIKKYGTWELVFQKRALDVLEPDGLHVHRLHRYITTDATRTIADLQGRLRSTMIEITGVIMDLIESGERKETSSIIGMDSEGNEIFGDVIDRPDKYVNYMKKIMHNEHDFIKIDIVKIIDEIMPNLDMKNLMKTLQLFTRFEIHHMKDFENIITDVLEISIKYLFSKNMRSNFNRSIGDVIIILKGYWRSSKVKDTKKVKDKIYKTSSKVLKKKTNHMLVTTTIAIVLYIVVRAFVKDRI